MSRGTTAKVGRSFIRKSKRSRPATKRSKSPGRVFGTSSQFKGVRVGVRGDPRR